MRRLLEEIIKEWWSWTLPAITKRQADIGDLYDEKLKKIITVTGFRRVGKTYLLFDFARRTDQKNCIYVNFEDERIPQETRVLTELISVIRELGGDKKFTLLLDEIQVIPDWSRWARRINDTHQHDLIITGSSSRLSSSDHKTDFPGYLCIGYQRNRRQGDRSPDKGRPRFEMLEADSHHLGP